MTQRIIKDPTTQTSKRKINQSFNVKTGNQLALQLLQQGVDLLTSQQLKIKNPKLIRKKQIENAYKYAKDIFNSNLLNKRVEAKRKSNIINLETGVIWKNYKTIKNLKRYVLIKVLRNGKPLTEFTLDKGGNKGWQDYVNKMQINSDTFFSDGDNIEIQMIQSKPIKKTKPIKQSFKEGKFNCVLNSIL